MNEESVSVNFISPLGTDGFQTGYQRNNKTGGQKHLRCFPQCNVRHNNTGFCGSSVIVSVNFPKEMNEGQFHAFATFRCTDDPNEPAYVTAAKIAANANNGEFPLNPWYVGKLVSTKSGEIKFEFNGDRRGWHYGWFATKSTREMFHLFKVYVYFTRDAMGDENTPLDLVTSSCSVPFQLCCTKRSKPDPSRKKRKSSGSTCATADDYYEERIKSELNDEYASAFNSYPAFDFVGGVPSGIGQQVVLDSAFTIAPPVPTPTTNKIGSVTGGSPALKYWPSSLPITHEGSEEDGSPVLKRMRTLPSLSEHEMSYSDSDHMLPKTAYGKVGGSPGLLDHHDTASSHGLSSPEHADDCGSTSGIGSMLGASNQVNFLDVILLQTENPFKDELHFETSHFSHDMPDDMSLIWREQELNHGIAVSEEAVFDHHEIALPSDFTWERNLMSGGFYLNTGNTGSSAGIPSAPSYNRLPAKHLFSGTATPTATPTEPGFLSRLYDLVTGRRSPDTRSRAVSTLSLSDYRAPPTPFSTPALRRPPIRKGSAAPVPLSYPPPPTAIHAALQRAADKHKKELVMPGSSDSTGKSSSRNTMFSSLLSPLKVLLIVLSIAVGYLVVDKFQSQGGTSTTTTVDSLTPAPDHGEDLKTTIAPTHSAGGYLDGYIPSWLLEEFSSPKCQCGSFATLLDFCKLHPCKQEMLDSTLHLSSADVSSNQYDLVKWVVTNKECLKDACDATSNADICDAAGYPSGAPSPSTSPMMPPVWSSLYCQNVDWSSALIVESSNGPTPPPIVQLQPVMSLR